MRLVVFINGDPDHGLYLPDATVTEEAISGLVENGLYDIVIQGEVAHVDDGPKFHVKSLRKVTIPPEVHGNYNHIIDWAKQQLL